MERLIYSTFYFPGLADTYSALAKLHIKLKEPVSSQMYVERAKLELLRILDILKTDLTEPKRLIGICEKKISDLDEFSYSCESSLKCQSDLSAAVTENTIPSLRNDLNNPNLCNVKCSDVNSEFNIQIKYDSFPEDSLSSKINKYNQFKPLSPDGASDNQKSQVTGISPTEHDEQMCVRSLPEPSMCDERDTISELASQSNPCCHINKDVKCLPKESLELPTVLKPGLDDHNLNDGPISKISSSAVGASIKTPMLPTFDLLMGSETNDLLESEPKDPVELKVESFGLVVEDFFKDSISEAKTVIDSSFKLKEKSRSLESLLDQRHRFDFSIQTEDGSNASDLSLRVTDLERHFGKEWNNNNGLFMKDGHILEGGQSYCVKSECDITDICKEGYTPIKYLYRVKSTP